MQPSKLSNSSQRKHGYSSWIWLIVTIIAIAAFTLLGPSEHSLGTHIRVVYLHGAWVWTSLAAFMVAGICGAIGLLTRKQSFHCWSAAFGRTGLVFWITYLPLSLWAMQSNWNGLFLAEPRWKLALVFAVSGILLQVGLTLADQPTLTSALNLGYFIALLFAILQAENVMHPTSPILNSEAFRIQLFFFGLVLLVFLLAWQISSWWYQYDTNRYRR